MYQVSRSRWDQVLLLGIAVLMTACSTPKIAEHPAAPVPKIAAPAPPAAKPVPKPSGKSSPVASPVAPAPPQGPPPASYSRALDKAESAQNIASSARSQDDWSLAVSQWQQAVQLMQSVPAAHAYYKRAQSKVGSYQRALASAKTRSAQTSNLGDNTVDSRIGADPTGKSQTGTAIALAGQPRPGQLFQAVIKRHSGGTPVIDVTFNGSQTFEMIVDTGASGTVITPQMASALGLAIVGKTSVNTASQRGVEVPLAYVESIAVGGAQVRGVTVAIANDALEVGLLGHDFFDHYDVTVKRDVVEFRLRS